ncbi:MAG: hypothetical protein QM733_14650 [Ilumatobacteraceae bacterium]
MRHVEEHPQELQPFPQQALASSRAGGLVRRMVAEAEAEATIERVAALK